MVFLLIVTPSSLAATSLRVTSSSLSLPSLTVTSSITGLSDQHPSYCRSDRFRDFHQCSNFGPARDWCQSKYPQPRRGPGDAWPDCHGDDLCEILDILRFLEAEEEREYLTSAWRVVPSIPPMTERVLTCSKLVHSAFNTYFVPHIAVPVIEQFTQLFNAPYILLRPFQQPPFIANTVVDSHALATSL